ncbi:hypothetical protein Pan216_47710 [Planctomycetes bacterium Pan216]|uniref:Intein C-terminal splicing domain-containing protein n=1 Tax=Kolteria novifilia TaxID=2527975 RepID=A0A518BA75_9BACT|nr:hypothetical protein Pan216_47710 [Planctomycetes bacterium Pan216]
MNDGASAKTLERPKRGRGRFAWVAFCLALAGSLFFAGMRSPQPTSANHAASLAVAAVTPEKLPTKAIEEVALGDRVVGTNPDRSEVEPTAEPDAKTWRHVTLWMTKADGGRLDIELLRPLAWLEAQEATVGDTIHLDLEEMGAHGPAVITAIAPCPEIEPGDGNVVTGRFIHQAAGNIVDLRLANQPEATGVTDNHRYWSVDRNPFIPAGKLRVGETLDTLHGRTTVASITPRSSTEAVYNLEVHNEHVYRVGTVGTLVHNNYVRDAAHNAANYEGLKDQLRRGEDFVHGEELLEEALHGTAIPMIGAGTSRTLRDAQRLADTYGGNAADWAKVGGSSRTLYDGRKVEIHWCQNLLTGLRVEFKTKIQ